MNVTSFVFEQVLKQLGIPPDAIRQLQIAGKLSDVDGSGFPAELFQLNAPMVTRGLLNFAVLQMKRDWLYPHWVHKQLNPKDKSFIARSQNPLLLNTTQRNWTMLGSPHGKHEAIVDPCGLVTPLPREWSVDVWLVTENELLLPSLTIPLSQDADTNAPRITTRFETNTFSLALETFVDTTNQGRDVLFQAVHCSSRSLLPVDALVCVSVRPFNPEGVAPIQHIEFKDPKQIYVDRCLGLVFAEEPQRVFCSNSEQGDAVNILRRHQTLGSWRSLNNTETNHSISCPHGLAHAVAIFPLSFLPGQQRSIHFSIALGLQQELIRLQPKSTWRVSFEKRRMHHQEQWQKERSAGATISIADDRIQKIFDANVLVLLQLHDGEFISPGPYLYHHFWFRDAAPMLHALDRLGYHKRVRQVLHAFPQRQTGDGFFRGPDGEWDSNGEVLWIAEQHTKLTHSFSWLKHFFPSLQQGAEWILQKKRTSKDTATTHRGLLPPSLSAEHFGTVDQYYWDSFWGLAGIRSAARLAAILELQPLAKRWKREAESFARDIERSLEIVAARLGRNVIPASPSRSLDESAVGFVCGIYPLMLEDVSPSAFKMTLDEFSNRYADERGFYHPIVHSGYNAYLTLQLAHAYLLQNDPHRAWNIADTILQQCASPYSLPEAIHPTSGGGSMGDGHHGWAAAEIILFLLDCFVREQGNTLLIFKNLQTGMMVWGVDSSVQGIATSFGKVGCSLKYQTVERAFCTFMIEPTSERMPEIVEITLPFALRRVLPVSANVDIDVKHEEGKTMIRFSSGNTVLLLER